MQISYTLYQILTQICLDDDDDDDDDDDYVVIPTDLSRMHCEKMYADPFHDTEKEINSISTNITDSNLKQ